MQNNMLPVSRTNFCFIDNLILKLPKEQPIQVKKDAKWPNKNILASQGG